jgi:hypothetical protein
VLKT